MLVENEFPLKSDESLVKLTLEDNRHYRYLVERYENKLLRYIMRIAKINSEDAKDILQEVFIKTYTNLNDFDTSLKFSSWIYRIAHNEAINFLRRNKNKPPVFNLEIDNISTEVVRADLKISEQIEQKYFLETLQKTINNIDNRDYRNVLILRYIEDRGYQEISDILKKPMGTVATLLNRAKKQLRNELLKDDQFLTKKI